MPPAHRRAPILCSLCTRGLRPVATNMPPAARAQGQARCRLRGNSAARGNGCCASGTASCGRGNITAAPRGNRPACRGLPPCGICRKISCPTGANSLCRQAEIPYPVRDKLPLITSDYLSLSPGAQRLPPVTPMSPAPLYAARP